MAQTKLPTWRVPHRIILRNLSIRPRLFSACAVGLGVALLTSPLLSPYTSAIVGWNAGALTFLLAALWMMLRTPVAKVKARAAEPDEGRFAFLGVTAVAGCFALFAIGFELHDAKDLEMKARLLHIGLAASTIVLSWFFVHANFALHYAHEFYARGFEKRPAPLEFPGETEPDYGDFLYFALVVGVAAQVSDVQVKGRSLRRLVTLHGALAFFFNTVILALAINIGSSLF